MYNLDSFYILSLRLSRFPFNFPYRYLFRLHSELPLSQMKSACLICMKLILLSSVLKNYILFLLLAWYLSCFTCVYLFVSTTISPPQGWHSGQFFIFHHPYAYFYLGNVSVPLIKPSVVYGIDSQSSSE